MNDTDALGKLFDEFSSSPDGVGFDLRLQLADLILEELRRKGWTQADLAEASGMKEAYISRVINADANCTFASVGKLVCALGCRVALERVMAEVSESRIGVQYGQETYIATGKAGWDGWSETSGPFKLFASERGTANVGAVGSSAQ